jgi:hypothetical protein
MKIKMTTGISGADFSLSPGDETDRFSTDEATRLIEAGFAVPVAGAAKERATKKAAPESRG